MHIVDSDVTEIIERHRAREIRKEIREQLKQCSSLSTGHYKTFIEEHLTELPYAYLKKINPLFHEADLSPQTLAQVRDDIINKRVRPTGYTVSIEDKICRYVRRYDFDCKEFVEYFIALADKEFSALTRPTQLGLIPLLRITSEEALKCYFEVFEDRQLDITWAAIKRTDQFFEDGRDFFTALHYGVKKNRSTSGYSGDMTRARAILVDRWEKAKGIGTTIEELVYDRRNNPPSPNHAKNQTLLHGFSARLIKNTLQQTRKKP